MLLAREVPDPLHHPAPLSKKKKENSTGYRHCYWLPFKVRRKTILLKMQHVLVAGHNRNQAGTDLITSSLLTSFHSDRMCYESCWRRKDTSVIILATSPSCCSTNLPGKYTHWGHSNMGYGSRQPLSDSFGACCSIGRNSSLVLQTW